MKVSFDYDGTLDREDVQEYAMELIERGVEVYVITSRFDDLHKHLFVSNPSNEDMYKVTDALMISRTNIYFMSHQLKWSFLKDTTLAFHLDDSEEEIRYINFNLLDIAGIDVNLFNWRQYCDIALKLK